MEYEVFRYNSMSIRYYLKPNKCSIPSIIVVCPDPRCGEEGNLKICKKQFSGWKYQVFHKGHVCTFAPSSPYNPILDRLYRTIRGYL